MQVRILSGAFGQWIVGIALPYILSEPKPKPSRFGVGVIIIMNYSKNKAKGRCMTKGCEGKARDTFCKTCCNNLGIFTRIRIYMDVVKKRDKELKEIRKFKIENSKKRLEEMEEFYED